MQPPAVEGEPVATLTRIDFDGTLLLKDIEPGSDNSRPDELVDVRGTLLFAADTEDDGEELWRSDGTAGVVPKLSDDDDLRISCFYSRPQHRPKPTRDAPGYIDPKTFNPSFQP